MQVTIETDEMRFNTAIAGMMEFMNAVYKWPNRPRAALEPFVLLLVRRARNRVKDGKVVCFVLAFWDREGTHMHSRPFVTCFGL